MDIYQKYFGKNADDKTLGNSTQPAKEHFIAQQNQNQAQTNKFDMDAIDRDINDRNMSLIKEKYNAIRESLPANYNEPPRQESNAALNTALGLTATGSGAIGYQAGANKINKFNPGLLAENIGNENAMLRDMEKTRGYSGKQPGLSNFLKNIDAVALEKKVLSNPGTNILDVIDDDINIKNLLKQREDILQQQNKSVYGFTKNNAAADLRIKGAAALNQNMADLEALRKAKYDYLADKNLVGKTEYAPHSSVISEATPNKPTKVGTNAPNAYTVNDVYDQQNSFDTKTINENKFTDDVRKVTSDKLDSVSEKIRPNTKSQQINTNIKNKIFGAPLPKNPTAMKLLNKGLRVAGPVGAVAGSVFDTVGGWNDNADKGLGAQTQGAIEGFGSGLTFGATKGISDSLSNAPDNYMEDIGNKAINIPLRFGNTVGLVGDYLGRKAAELSTGKEIESEYKPWFSTLKTTTDDAIKGSLFNDAYQQTPKAPIQANKNPAEPQAPVQVNKNPAESQANNALGITKPKRPMQDFAGQKAQATSQSNVSRYDFAPDTANREEYGKAYYTNVGAEGETFNPPNESENDPMVDWARRRYGTMAGTVPFEDLLSEYSKEMDRSANTNVRQQELMDKQQGKVQDMSMLAVSGKPEEQRMAVETLIQQSQRGSEPHKQALTNVFAQRIRDKTGADWFDPTTWFNTGGDKPFSRNQNNWKYAKENGFTGQMLDLGNGVTMNYSELDDIEKQIFNLFMDQ